MSYKTITDLKNDSKNNSMEHQLDEKHQKMLDKLTAFLETDEGKKSLQEFADKIEKESIDAQKANDILVKLSYEQRRDLFMRIAAKHDERWNSLCYSRGYEPYPWNIVYPLFKAADQFGDEYDYDQGPLDDFDLHFGAYTKVYLGFYFNTIHGQGTVIRIFDKDKVEIFSS